MVRKEAARGMADRASRAIWAGSVRLLAATWIVVLEDSFNPSTTINIGSF